MFNVENLGKETGNHNEGEKSHFKWEPQKEIVRVKSKYYIFTGLIWSTHLGKEWEIRLKSMVGS